MLLLTIEDLSHSYGDKVLFSHVSFNIEDTDRIGLIGVNGTGKSTLLRHVALLDGGDTGGFVRKNGHVTLEYLPQDPPFDPEATIMEQIFAGPSSLMDLLRAYEKALASSELCPADKKLQEELILLQQKMDEGMAWQIESEAKRVLTRLGITDFDKKMGELSGGQQKRVALAGVLVRPSDLLILDEPTNHMDTETVAWLEAELGKRRGALLMVTHDRYFFDRVVNRTIELDRGRAYFYDGNYTHFLEKRAERKEKESADKRRLVTIYKRELAWISRGAEARRTKSRDRVERFASLKEAATSKIRDRSLEMTSAASRLGRTIIEIEGLGARYGDTWYVKDFSYTFLKRDRIGITGPNGAGKTTLMDMIAGKRRPDAGRVKRGSTVRIGYFSQIIRFPEPNMKVLDYVREAGEYVTGADGSQISAALMLEKFLFPEELQWVEVGRLSGGEQRRLQLLRILMETPNVLLLDEPTNNLDIPTLSVLEDYLDTFQGAVAAVSHDRYFLDRMADKIFAFEDGTIREYPGGWSDYARLREERRADGGAQEIKKRDASPRAPKKTQPDAKKLREGALSYSQKLEKEQLEQEIARKDAEIKMLEKTLEMQQDAAAIADIGSRLAAAQNEADRMLERWRQLEELDG